MTTVVVALVILMMIGVAYSRSAAKKREVRIAFVRDSVQKAMTADSLRQARQADSMRAAMASSEQRYQAERDSAMRVMACRKRDIQARMARVERMSKACF